MFEAVQSVAILNAAQNAGNGSAFLYGMGAPGFAVGIVFIFFTLGIIVFTDIL